MTVCLHTAAGAMYHYTGRTNTSDSVQIRCVQARSFQTTRVEISVLEIKQDLRAKSYTFTDGVYKHST